MTPFPYAISINDSITSASELMRSHQIRHLPVTQQQQLVGIVTDRDIQLLLDSATGSSVQQTPTVADVYTSHPVIVDLNEHLDKVAMTMADQHIDAILVTKKGKLAGIFTASDACRYLGRHLREYFAPPDGDEAA